MTRVLLTNLKPDISDEDIRAFLAKYGLPPCDEIEHVPGDGTRPAAELVFHAIDADTLRKALPRIHHIFWNQRELSALILSDRFT
ncbi:RNA-binding protein [Cupriavidus sp. 2TAF22]|uniref:RNA-binding protein n=1 Tax=unclassified Cupriavidus TaxID=2640874 RepID=UPI003F8FCF7F